MSATTATDTNSAIDNFFAQVSSDNEILALCAVSPDTADEDAAARRWVESDAVEYVMGARLCALDLASDEVACVGDMVDVDDDGVATLR